MRRLVPLLALLCAAAAPVRAQDNYEIQVYGADLVPKAHTMFELHSNFTFRAAAPDSGTFPTYHALHETLEITHGFSDWFETGFYFFTSTRDGQGFQWVGDHIRPRFSAPESWGLPVGLSLSQEFGYVRPAFSADTWTWEIRPIIDKHAGPWYVALNPALEKSWVGPSAAQPFSFSPNVQVSVDATKQVNLALEYYGAFGPINGFDPYAAQQHQLFGAINLNLSEDWEFNLGYGLGFTNSTDRGILKMILGRLMPF